MKITLTFEGDEQSPKTSLKIDLPVKWMDGPLSRVRDTFVSNFNKKNPTCQLQDVHLVAAKQGQVVPLDANVGRITQQFGDTFLVLRGLKEPTAAAPIPQEESDDEEDVTTKKGIEKAKNQHAFDYSKWDKLDLSDDDGLDCHPNIELASWKRIKAQQRAERRQKEEAEIKRLKAKMDDFAKQGNAAQAEKYRNKLAEFEKTRKWVADDVCDTKEDRTVVPKEPKSETQQQKPAVVGPVDPDQEFYETYESYVAQHEDEMRKFAAIDNNRPASQEFLEQHPALLNKHADGFLLLLCLDVAMRNAGDETRGQKGKRELRRVVQQHLLLNYILELAKLSKLEDVRAAVRPFFAKTAQQTKEQQAEFETELTAFISRIENRAKEKLAKGERSPLEPKKKVEEDEYEPAEVGPGGLDPTEVLQSLPKDMQEAFVEQDVPKLQAILRAMDPADASYHLDRCIASGLWVVPPKQPGEPDSEDEDEVE